MSATAGRTTRQEILRAIFIVRLKSGLTTGRYGLPCKAGLFGGTWCHKGDSE